ncbi:hypothetical protein RPYSC3_25650 [Rhodopseudomonas palustris]|nr:hypothetical protein RPYSC3_25650 [Rhodopseudomonas palustris]
MTDLVRAFALTFSIVSASASACADDAWRRIGDLVERAAPRPVSAVESLGQRLFSARSLSRGRDTSCADCHIETYAWTEPRRIRRTAHGDRRTPSLVGAKYSRWQFWDGRAPSLEYQALEALSAELGAEPNGIAAAIEQDADLSAQYAALRQTGELPVYDCLRNRDECESDTIAGHVAFAIAQFVRSIRSGCTLFDNLMAARPPFDTEQPALRGALVFAGKANCIICHNGPGLTDGEFHNIGVPNAAETTKPDLGRLTGLPLLKNAVSNDNQLWLLTSTQRAEIKELVPLLKEADGLWGQFKTPSLRGVARRPPYMHNGYFDTLKQVIDFYDSGGLIVGPSKWEPLRDHHSESILLPLNLTEQEKADLLAFLESLDPPLAEGVETCPHR